MKHKSGLNTAQHPRSRRVLSLLLALAACALAACTEALHHDLEESRANELLHVLRSESIAAEKVRDESGRWQVRAPSTQTRRALAIMLRDGLPRRAEDLSAQLAETSGLVPNPEDERSRRLHLLQLRLERSLEAMPGVLEARVHAVAPRSERRGVAPPPPRASVLLVLREGEPGPANDLVQALLAGALDGLEPERIAIVHATRAVPEVPLAAVVRVGPIAVLEESRAVLALLVLAAGLLLLLLVGATAASFMRQSDEESTDA